MGSIDNPNNSVLDEFSELGIGEWGASLILTSLPEEVQLNAFKFLGSADVMRLSLVCHSLHRLSKDASLWPLKWDFTVKKDTILLSNNELSATSMSHEGGCAVVRASRGYKVGKNYWEILIEHSCWNSAFVFGVVDQRFSEKKSPLMSNYLGSVKGGWGKAQQTLPPGSKIGILMDFNKPKLRLYYYIEGRLVDVLQVFDVPLSTTHLYPAVSMWMGGNTVTWVNHATLPTLPPIKFYK
eukprot:TRINITY_DN5583_c0_g1_i1.p1 TRINITY_DN5583_c0_g1~~TRINITY_DN5583_c0_g1_i1.p1  ORF type:complete len:239 (-),score=38.60 TRINITY_DN5583_c0_g1_i1:92-808(-)